MTLFQTVQSSMISTEFYFLSDLVDTLSTDWVLLKLSRVKMAINLSNN
jgi:hypothetical protein